MLSSVTINIVILIKKKNLISLIIIIIIKHGIIIYLNLFLLFISIFFIIESPVTTGLILKILIKTIIIKKIKLIKMKPED